MRKWWIWALLGAVAAIGAICLGNQLGKAVEQRAVPEVIPLVSTTPKQIPSPGAIGEGTWDVGQDVKAGKYKTAGALETDIPLCYWHVSVDGQIRAQGVKDKVGAQDIVTLHPGETFETNGCAPWYASK